MSIGLAEKQRAQLVERTVIKWQAELARKSLGENVDVDQIAFMEALEQSAKDTGTTGYYLNISTEELDRLHADILERC